MGNVINYGDFGYWFLQSVAMGITALLLPKLKITHPLGALIMVISLAFVNAKIWDAAIFFQVPDTLSTQTGILLISNGVLFWLLVKLLPGIEVEGFFSALIAPIIFTVTSIGISYFADEIDWQKTYEEAITFISALKEYLDRSPPEIPPT